MIDTKSENPWYVQFFLAMGGWTSGLLAALAIFSVSSLIVVRDFDVAAFFSLILGTAFVFVGCLFARGAIGEFRRHFSIASVAAGFTTATAGLWYLLASGIEGGEVGLGVSGLITSFVLAGAGFFVTRQVRDPILVFLISLAVYGVFTASIFFLGGDNSPTPGLQLVTSALAVFGGAFSYLRRHADPIARGVAAACLIGPLAFFLFVGEFSLMRWELLNTPWSLRVADFVLFAALAWTISRIKQPHQAVPIIVLVLSAAAALFLADYSLVAIIILIVGIASGHRGLAGIGVCALAWTLWRFYYDPQITLLAKSISLIVLGVATLAGAFVVRLFTRGSAEPRQKPDFSWSPRLLHIETWGVAAALIVGLVLVNTSVHRLETAFAEAETIYLPLGPRDPRSIIQGDYMRLRFDRQLLPEADVIRDLPRDGEVYLEVDADRVASFSRLSEAGSEPEPNEIRVNFIKSSKGMIRYCPDTFFFQEGDATAYQIAAFAVVKVAPGGETLLVALTDRERNVIDPAEANSEGGESG